MSVMNVVVSGKLNKSVISFEIEGVRVAKNVHREKSNNIVAGNNLNKLNSDYFSFYLNSPASALSHPRENM